MQKTLIVNGREIKPGDKIKLVYMDDRQAPPPGTVGTVSFIDDANQIHMRWPSGGSLALIPGEDKFIVL